MSREIPLRPEGSRIELVESTDERIVLDIIPGNERTTRMGWFLLVGIFFLCYFSRPQAFAHFQHRPALDHSRLKYYLYVAGAWIVVVCGFVNCVRLQFERITLLIQHDRVVVERVLFGWKRSQEVAFNVAPSALLLDSFRGRFYPRQLVGIVGPNVRITFGRMLSDSEKDWLVARINLFLRAGSDC